MSAHLDYPFARSGPNTTLSQRVCVDRPQILSVRTGSVDGSASASCPDDPPTRWTAGDKHQPFITADLLQVVCDGRMSMTVASLYGACGPERSRDVGNQEVGESPRTIRPRDGIGKAGLLLVPQPRPNGHTSTIASGITLRTYARKEGLCMAGVSRVTRLAGDIDDHIDELEAGAWQIAQDISDGIVTATERDRIATVLAQVNRALHDLSIDVQIVADSHQLAKQALSSDGVSPWVVRSAQEKGADYLRLVPDNVVPFRQPERRTAS